MTKILSWLLVGVLFLVCSGAAWAQTGVEPSSTPILVPAWELNATDIPSEKVDQFVSAYLQVVALIDDRGEDLQRAETEADSLRVQQAIQAEAFRLIEAAGLRRQDYWQLLGLANTDPEFRDRVLAQLEEREQ